MKIGDIQVGTEYGVTNGRRRTYYGDLPRRVTALGVETVEVEYWQGGGFAATRAKKNVRQVRVRFEDEATSTRTWDDGLFAVPKGQERVIEARFMVAPWKELRRDVQGRIDTKQTEAEAKKEYENRVKALLPKKMRDDWFYATAHADGTKLRRIEMQLEGRVLDTILDLAEKGAAVEQEAAA